MDRQITEKMIGSISNAVKSLYQLIVLVEEGTGACRIIDKNDEISNLIVNGVRDYKDLYEALFKNVHPEEREEFKAFYDIGMIDEALSRNVYISSVFRIRRKDSRYYWSRLTICNSSIEDNTEGNEYLVLLQDIHNDKDAFEKEKAELIGTLCRLKDNYDALFIENMTDSLTGCYNRKGLGYFEAIALKESKDNDKNVFVCVLDLNGLKHMNDTYGHKAGDAAICAVADALKAAAPAGASIVRTGGDEFLIFAPLENNSSEPETFSDKLEAGLKEYNKNNPDPCEISASYGYVFLPVSPDMEKLDAYIEMADQKMYVMKEETDPYKR